MGNEVDYIELVSRAQLGDKEGLGELCELVRGRLYAYVYRIMLRHEAAEEIVQDTLVEMVEAIGELRDKELFWPWLRGIAFNKIKRQYQREKRKKMALLSNASFVSGNYKPDKGKGGLEQLVNDELKEIVTASMRELKPEHRSVLSMRCYEGMEYSEIAELLGRSELSARVLFLRARRSLQKQLTRRGLGRGALLTALLLFGKMTAPSEAAAAELTVTAGSMKVGLAAGAAGLVSSKAFLASLTTAGVITVGSVVVQPPAEKTPVVPIVEEKVQRQQITPVVERTSVDEFREQWYFYPSDAAGAVMTRVMRAGPGAGQWYFELLENEQANYCYDRAEHTIYVNNHRQWNEDLSVRRLVTDKPGLREFLDRVEGKRSEISYVSARGEGFLVSVRPNDQEYSPRIFYHENVIEEEYFRYDWPAGAKIVDNRDAMHKRGWAHFRITGWISEEEVSGAGRTAFVYEASLTHRPWLRLKVGRRVFSGAGFFGLSRQWMGLHTIDTVRRDAAEAGIGFETSYTPGGKAKVILSGEKAIVTYTIDMERDLIEKISLLAKDGVTKIGELKFTYLDDESLADREFNEAMAKHYSGLEQTDPGKHWLMELAESAVQK